MATEVYNVNWEVDYQDGSKDKRHSHICFSPWFNGPKKPFSELRIYYKNNRVDEDVIPILRDVFKRFKIKAKITKNGPDYKGQWMITFKSQYNTFIEGKIYATMSRYLDESAFPQTLREYKKFRDKKVPAYKALILAHAITGAGNGHSLIYSVNMEEKFTVPKLIERIKAQKSISVHQTIAGTEDYFGKGKNVLLLNTIKEKIDSGQDYKQIFKNKKIKKI